MSRNLPPDYLVHDGMYKAIKEAGYEGWGGPEVGQRTRDWENDIQCLMEHCRDWPKQGKILELGCGEGKLSFVLAKAGYDVAGIDVSRTAITWAEEKAAQQGLSIDFHSGSVTDLGSFSNADFDIVFDALCTHCIIGEDRAVMYREIKRVLKKGGLFYLNCQCGGRENPNAGRVAEFDEATNCEIRDNRPYRYIGTEKELTAEIQEHGFKILKKELIFTNGKPHKIKLLAGN